MYNYDAIRKASPAPRGSAPDDRYYCLALPRCRSAGRGRHGRRVPRRRPPARPPRRAEVPARVGTADPLATERFLREARTASALNHPNICTLHDVGEHEGRRFIVMELLDGAHAGQASAAGRCRSIGVIDIGDQIADALDAAHSEGILHRDIKPGNIFITKRGQAKVLDFGLAKMMPHRSGLTAGRRHDRRAARPDDAGHGRRHRRLHVARARPRRGGRPRSDLFSLGVVLYEMATGVQTFKGQTTAVIFDQILNRVPVPPSALNPDVIPTLEHIIGRLLEKDRERRYQSSREVQADLQRLKRDLDARRVVTADAVADVAPATWAPFEETRSASTVAVNVPTFGVEAEPAPVPAAWAHDWEHARPPSHPEVESLGVRQRARSEPRRQRDRDHLPRSGVGDDVDGAGIGVGARAVPEPHASCPPPAPPPLSRTAVQSPRHGRRKSARRRLRAACAGVETALATERRVAAERAGAAPHQTDEAPTVPASWTSSPPSTPNRARASEVWHHRSRCHGGDAGARLGRHLVDAAGPRGPVSGATAVAPAPRPHPAGHAHGQSVHARAAAGRRRHAARGDPAQPRRGRRSPVPRRPAATARVTAPGPTAPAPPGRRAGTSVVEGDAGAGSDHAL